MNYLKAQKKWFCWKYKMQNGKITKHPVSAHNTPTGTNEKFSSSWVTYSEAKAAAIKFGFDGVGFIIPKGYFFLDIDSRDVSDPYVQQFLKRFNSYAELSVSGNGIHIYGKYDITRIPTYTDKEGRLRLGKEYYMKNPNNGTELYLGDLTNRYAVYTDDVVYDAPLCDCTDAILLTLDQNMKKQKQTSTSKKKQKSDAAQSVLAKQEDESVSEIVKGLLSQKNGEKFRKLYADGDTYAYPSPSEADNALCAMIAFRTGPEPDKIDSVFRSSALMRDKWEREDYRERTIEAGIKACNGIFYVKRPDFIECDNNGVQKVNAALLADHIRRNLKYLLVRDNANQELQKYVYKDGVYRLYSNEMFMGVIKQYIEDYDLRLVKMNTVREVALNLTTDLNCIAQDDLNSDESIINFQNGILKISEDGLELSPHTPSVYSTIQIPSDWTEEPQPTPVFDGYMNTLTNGDKEVEHLLLEFIGACISNIYGWRMKKALFLVGQGNTGKSQLKSLVERILGKDNFTGIDMKTIEARFGTSALYGKRLAGSSDMSFMSVDELKTFKAITGGDTLFAEFKGQKAFEFTYKGLLWFCMNQLPRFGGDNGKWVYDRIMIVRCDNVIPKEKQDKFLLDKMYDERQGIVYKAIQALMTVIQNGYNFSEPKSVIAEREKYMIENNTVSSFFNECMCPSTCTTSKSNFTTGEIYEIYRRWCGYNNNSYAKTIKRFQADLSEYLEIPYNALVTRIGGCSYFKDYTLTEEAAEQYCAVTPY